MNQISIQTKCIINDENPLLGFNLIKNAGFNSVDFSLNTYLTNKEIYGLKLNNFFDKSINELEEYFTPHKLAASECQITFNQMHMPYPMYLSNGNDDINDYLQKNVAIKSLQICKFLNCSYIVVHGFKLARLLGSEYTEWEQTEKFLKFIGSVAKELGIVICLENIYTSIDGRVVEGPCCDARLLADRIDKLNDTFRGEVFGACFDTGHANLIKIDFEDFLTTLGDRLKVLHIHDNNGIADLHQIPFTFSSSPRNQITTDWAGFIKGLKNINFDKALSFETAPVLQAFPPELKEEVLKFIAEIGIYFAREVSK